MTARVKANLRPSRGICYVVGIEKLGREGTEVVWYGLNAGLNWLHTRVNVYMRSTDSAAWHDRREKRLCIVFEFVAQLSLNNVNTSEIRPEESGLWDWICSVVQII